MTVTIKLSTGYRPENGGNTCYTVVYFEVLIKVCDTPSVRVLRSARARLTTTGGPFLATYTLMLPLHTSDISAPTPDGEL